LKVGGVEQNKKGGRRRELKAFVFLKNTKKLDGGGTNGQVKMIGEHNRQRKGARVVGKDRLSVRIMSGKKRCGGLKNKTRDNGGLCAEKKGEKRGYQVNRKKGGAKLKGEAV